MRTRAERRKNTWKKANRQVEIEKNAEGIFSSEHKPLLKHIHAYSKNKVPFAVPWMKTRVEPDIVDKRKLEDMTQQEKELDENLTM